MASSWGQCLYPKDFFNQEKFAKFKSSYCCMRPLFSLTDLIAFIGRLFDFSGLLDHLFLGCISSLEYDLLPQSIHGQEIHLCPPLLRSFSGMGYETNIVKLPITFSRRY